MLNGSKYNEKLLTNTKISVKRDYKYPVCLFAYPAYGMEHLETNYSLNHHSTKLSSSKTTYPGIAFIALLHVLHFCQDIL